MDQPPAPPPRPERLSTGRVPPALLPILALLAVAVILIPALIVAYTPRIVPVEKAVARVRPPQRVISRVELPPVEPAEFVPIDPTDARAYNASIPFSTAPLLAARPFRITGDEASVARATDCLAAGALYEAGDDTVGQRAVAQVILNRVRHPAFPKTICGVVFQGAERRTGCQFTFTCDGALARRYSDAAWGRAHDVAEGAVKGRVEKAVGTATHYHTDWVVPYWSASLDKISEVHTHLFFRWTGWWGTPPAFRGRYAGAEPLVAKLKGIAASHGAATDTLLPDVPVLDAAAIPADAVPAPIATDPNTFLVTLDPRLKPADFAGLALRTCGERPYCKLLAWTDRADTPAALPADPRQMGRIAFSFLRDRKYQFEKMLWNCERYSRSDPTQCVRPQLVLPGEQPKARPGAIPVPSGAAATAPAGPIDLPGVRRRTGTLTPAAPAAVVPPPVRPTIAPEASRTTPPKT